MTPDERRAAALANQRAAAFIRFQLLGDHQAMHLLLTDLGDQRSQLGFMTALASIGSSVLTRQLGEKGALDYLKLLAETSATLAD